MVIKWIIFLFIESIILQNNSCIFSVITSLTMLQSCFCIWKYKYFRFLQCFWSYNNNNQCGTKKVPINSRVQNILLFANNIFFRFFMYQYPIFIFLKEIHLWNDIYIYIFLSLNLFSIFFFIYFLKILINLLYLVIIKNSF